MTILVPNKVLRALMGNIGNSVGKAAKNVTTYESDTEVGLYYYRARYYDPSTGRFLNEDPTGFKGGINLYGCVGNDPINKTDPDGTGFVDCLKALADLARATANLEKDLRNIPKGACPDPGHQKELRQRYEDLNEALKLVVKHCGKYAGAATAIAAAKSDRSGYGPLEERGRGRQSLYIFPQEQGQRRQDCRQRYIPRFRLGP